MIVAIDRSTPVIVVVDDDVAVRNSLKFLLEIEGYVVRTFADGADLLDAQDLPASACLIVDQNLPGLNGLEIVDQLRARRYCAPAILITTNPSPALRENARRAGVAIVEKPLLENVLIDRVRTTISRPSGD